MSVEVVLAIIGALGAFAAGVTKLVHWAVKHIAKTVSSSADKSCAAQDRATDAIIENTKVTTTLVERLTSMSGKIDDMWKRAGGATPLKRTQTPHRGVHRLPTNRDTEDE